LKSSNAPISWPSIFFKNKKITLLSFLRSADEVRMKPPL
jgi:hypothetical protein